MRARYIRLSLQRAAAGKIWCSEAAHMFDDVHMQSGDPRALSGQGIRRAQYEVSRFQTDFSREPSCRANGCVEQVSTLPDCKKRYRPPYAEAKGVPGLRSPSTPRGLAAVTGERVGGRDFFDYSVI